MSRKAQAEESRNRLIDTALAVFAQKGWGNTSISDLAKAAGMAVGLFYHYFDSKEQLLEAVIARHTFLPQLQNLMAVSTDKPARLVLPQLAVGFENMLHEERPLVTILISEAQTNPQIEAQLESLIAQGVKLLAAYLTARIEAGELRPHQAELTARTLLYTIFMSQLIQLSDPAFVTNFVQFLLTNIVNT